MIESTSPAAFYERRLAEFQQVLLILKKRRQRVSVLRILTVLATLCLLYFAWKQPVWLRTVLGLAGAIFFFSRVWKDQRLKQEIDNVERLAEINRHELDAIAHRLSRYDDGNDLKPLDHPYANDLDIFGPNSLFQYIYRGNAGQSRMWLANALLKPADPAEIIDLQETVKELKNRIPWSQQLLAHGKNHPITTDTEAKITDWLQQPEDRFTGGGWKWLLYLYPVAVGVFIILYAFDFFQTGYLILGLIACWFFSSQLTQRISPVYNKLSGIAPEIDSLFEQLRHLESGSLTSNYYSRICSSLTTDQKSSASSQIAALNGILKRFDMRYNIYVFIFLNTFLLWDLRQMLALMHWKRQNVTVISHWFTAIAKMETAIGFSSLSVNNPAWTFPVLSNDFFTLSATSIGHPLIPPATMVANSFTMQGLGKLSLITGSNMAGKSTFLRSIGINIVLAQAGSAVCAAAFIVSPVRLISSMRVADNLAESTSTFYAELKKLKSVIDAVNAGEKVFILLDEMLRGTNSEDRHIGSRAMIRQLITRNAVAMVATHDLELANSAPELRDAISNYYFDVQVSNDELYFDYLLKPGVCKSLNASILMRKIGIDLNT